MKRQNASGLLKHLAPFAIAQRCLTSFAILMNANYRVPPHISLIARKLERVNAGKSKRLMVFMPPRHGKSMLCSEYFPAWYLGQKPSNQLIHITYAQEFADDFGRKVRNTIADPLFMHSFPDARLSEDSSSAKRFHTQAGGVYFAVGTGGPITGRGADLLLIDDAIKNREVAESEVERRKIKEWYSSVARTRLMPGGAIVIIQTRWHEDDLCGWILKEHTHENWEVLSLPAIADEEDEIGRKPGEALWPESYPIESLIQLKNTLSSRDWNALYQQRPMPEEGEIIKLAWFKRYSELPVNRKRIIQSWDTASKAKDINDYSVCTTWLEVGTTFYLIDVFRKRMEYPALKRAAIQQAERFKPQMVLIEDTGSGQSLLQDLRSCTRLSLLAVKPKADKVIRTSAITAVIESGRVFLPEAAPWLADYEAELSVFPLGKHDDQVDSTSQALQYLQGSSKKIEIFTANPITGQSKFSFQGY
jgi:predicted phage terminase large subunit-like protein